VGFERKRRTAFQDWYCFFIDGFCQFFRFSRLAGQFNCAGKPSPEEYTSSISILSMRSSNLERRGACRTRSPLHSRNWTRFRSLRPLRSWVGSWRRTVLRVVLAYGAVSADRSLGITISADCNKQLAHAYIDSGCIRVQDGQFLAPFLRSLRHWLLRIPVGCQGANEGKLPIEIVVTADERHHTSVRKPRTHASRRASEAPVSAWAVAAIRPVPIIIALYPVPLHPVWQTPDARFLVSIPLFRSHLATKHAIHKNEVAESEAHPQRPPNKPHS